MAQFSHGGERRMAEQYILGLDFGTDSVRAVIINAKSGKEEANQVSLYKR